MRIRNSGTFALGTGYAFIVVDRAWLNGKYLRFRWTATLTTASVGVLIYDGSYDRSSDVDFPSSAPLLLKGNGLLQTLTSTGASFGWETRDLQTNLGAGSEEFCTVFFKARDHTSPGNVLLDLDWFEINSGVGGAGAFYDEQFTDVVTMERTGTFGDYGYISTGTAIPKVSIELGCGFEVGQGSIDLPASFVSAQGRENLGAKFEVGQDSVELLGGFLTRGPGSSELAAGFITQSLTAVNLLATMNVVQLTDLPAKFRVTKTYDLRGTAGIAFYWWGANNPPEALNQLRLETPTGFWYSDFVDGPASFRHVFIPWGSFTWVSTTQRSLEPHRHGLNAPDRSQIDAILFTIHTTGVRRIDYIYAPLMALFPCKFTIRRSTSQNLAAGFNVRRSETYNLPCGFTVRLTSNDLSAKFNVSISLFSICMTNDKIYMAAGISENIVESFPTPYSTPQAITFDGNDIISGDWSTDLIYVHEGINDTIRRSFDTASPTSNIVALTFANPNLISGYQIGTIYIHDGISDAILDAWGQGISLAGLAFDGTNLISCDSTTIYVHDGLTSAITRSFAAPANMAGLAFDGTDLISLSWAQKLIYVHDGISETIKRSFPTPGSGDPRYTKDIAVTLVP